MTHCMVRPCVARGVIDLSACGLALMYPASDWSVLYSGAIMGISARVFSLGDRPRMGQMGHQDSQAPGRPVLHFLSSLSQTSAGKRYYVIALSRSVQFLCSCREAVPSSWPARCAGHRAQGPSRLAVAVASVLAFAFPGYALTIPSTVPRSRRLRAPSYRCPSWQRSQLICWT